MRECMWKAGNVAATPAHARATCVARRRVTLRSRAVTATAPSLTPVAAADQPTAPEGEAEAVFTARDLDFSGVYRLEMAR